MAKCATIELIKELPKVDLHLHLDGSVKPETMLALARAQGVKLPSSDLEGIRSYMQVKGDCVSLQDYLGKFEWVGKVLHTAEALERVAYELVEQAAEQRCAYIEVRFAPQLHRGLGLTNDEVIAHVIAGLQRGERSFGVLARGISVCMRTHEYQQNREVIEATAPFIGKGMVAVDLAGDEASHPAGKFVDVFALADKLHIPVTIHAGEAAGPENVRDAVLKLGATRIGHGVRIREDRDVLRMVRQRGIPLEMCPISNIQTKSVPAWDVYPIHEYLEHGIPVTVNTDNLTVSNTTITNEYAELADRFHFGAGDIKRLIMNGVEAAFLSDTEKRSLKHSMKTKMERFGIA